MNLWSRFTSLFVWVFYGYRNNFPRYRKHSRLLPQLIERTWLLWCCVPQFSKHLNTDMQKFNELWLVAALFSVFVKIIILWLKRKWAHCISISFRIPSRGRRGVWYQALVLCFRTKVNAYYVCFNTEYRWLKGCGKQIPLKKMVFFCYMHLSNLIEYV